MPRPARLTKSTRRRTRVVLKRGTYGSPDNRRCVMSSNAGYGRKWKKWLAIYAAVGVVVYLIIYLIFAGGGGGGGVGY